MRSALFKICALALLPMGGVALSQPTHEAVELVDSAYHVPVFSNEFITLLKVQMPPGRGSDFHHHRQDQISVYMADYPAEAEGQEPGEPVHRIRPNGKGPYMGDVSFSNFTKKQLINRGQNGGATTMKVLQAVFKSPSPYGFNPQPREGYTQVLDNDRVRAWRLILAPGQSAPAISQTAPGMRIVVKGGDIAEISEGKRDRGMFLDPGDFFWQDAGPKRVVRNIGTTTVELVEFELK
ncbi:hypothetical protein [Sphingobium boeckii]|uniref:Uncharacterized protein n=1 Tax=Sphingobium boeckii TaxID=1082345 RepID=A0A7W9ALJ2_9SPHN|nr:hypothetical protein [Sphingobium boeckii]MBB5687748.1 hypothetical protein [Sphingobium boeckii]